GEVARMLPADLIDEEERGADRPVRFAVGDHETNPRDRPAGILGRGRLHGHRDRLEANSRERALVHHAGDLARIQPRRADLLEWTLRAPPFRERGPLEVDGPRITGYGGQRA